MPNAKSILDLVWWLMMKNEYAGLKPVELTAYPKKCSNCGRIYETAEQFLNDTLDMPRGNSSLRADIDDDGYTVIVEAFRNCRCGSTLMDNYCCRRDQSPEGIGRRARFEQQTKPEDQ